MTTEEQAAEDERAREAALRSIASMGDVGSQTASALTPATEPDAAFDAEGVGPTSIEPSSEPDPQAELNTDLTSGVAGVDGIHDYDYEALPREEVPAPAPAPPMPAAVAPPNPDAETYGMATDADPTLPGSFRDMAPGDPPDAETHGYATDADATFPGSLRKPPVDSAREASAGPLPTLFYGLPSEDEIGRAHTSDDWRRALHAIGSGLMVAGGRSPTEFHGQAEGLEQERRAGIQAALQRKGVMRGQEQTQAATSARQAVEDRLRERQAAQRDRGLDLQEQALPSRIAATEALTEQRGASTEHTRATTEDVRAEAVYRSASRADLDSATSGAADAERAAIAARLALMGAPAREAATAAITGEGDLSTMNANQLHRIREGLTAGVGLRGAGRGGGDGGARSDAQIAEMVSRLGMSEDEARQHRTAVGADAVSRELAGTQSLVAREGGASQRARAPLAEGQEGPELLQGLHAGIALEPGEARAARTAFRAAADSMAAIGGLEQIGQEFGWRGSFTPEAIQRARPRLMQMRHMAALIQGTGVINPTEVPVIDAAIADPTSLSQTSLETFGAALDEWRQIMHENLRNALGDTGYAVQEGVDEALQRFERAGHGGASSGTGRAPARASRATAPAEDFSQMSDEELRALAEGD